jgi:hypothetical protein
MEHRGYPHRAHKLALLAMKNVQLSHNQVRHTSQINNTNLLIKFKWLPIC